MPVWHPLGHKIGHRFGSKMSLDGQRTGQLLGLGQRVLGQFFRLFGHKRTRMNSLGWPVGVALSITKMTRFLVVGPTYHVLSSLVLVFS